MPISFEDLDEVEKKEGGSGLRRRLEEALAENRKLGDENVAYKAQDVIKAGGYSLVKPDDLKGIDPSKIEEHAKKIHEDRQAQQLELAKDMFVRRGLSGDELDAAVADFLAPSQDQRQADDFEQLNGLTRVAGSPVPQVDPSKLHGLAAIEFGLAQKTRKP